MRKTGRGWMLIAAMVALGACVTAPLAAEAQTKPRPRGEIVVGVVNALTGPGADLGIAAKQALDPLVKEINEAGGSDGWTVRVIYRDDESVPQKAAAAVEELINRHRVDIIMGANLTHVATALNPIINNAKVLFVTMGTGSHLIDPRMPYTFRLNMHTDIEAEVIVKYVLERRGAKKPGLLVDATAYGQSGGAALTKFLTARNMQPAGVQKFNTDDTDMSGQLLQLKNAGADALLVWGLGRPLARVAKSKERVQWDVPVVGGFGTHQQAFIDLAGDAGKNWFATIFKAFTQTESAPAPQATREFVAKQDRIWGKDLTATVFISALWDDAVRLYLDAVKRAGSKEIPAVKAALEQTKNFKGIISTYSFSADHRDGFDRRDATIAYTLDVKNHIRKRLPDAP